MDTNYLCEQKLKRENPQLHKRVVDSVVCVERMLVAAVDAAVATTAASSHLSKCSVDFL